MEKAIKNINAERILIGILLNHPDWTLEISNNIKPEYFFNTGHKSIYYLIIKLLSEGVDNIDTMSILSKAEKIDKMTEVIVENGGIEWIETLKELSEHYDKDDLKRYTIEVVCCAYKRDQLNLTEELVRLLHDKPEMTINDVVHWNQEKNKELEAKYTVGSETGLIGEMFEEIWQEIEANRQEDGGYGLPSKISLLNSFIGYQNGELTVYGARAKYGKSNFAINEVHFLAVQHGVPVAYFDTEMKTRTFMARLLAIDSGVNAREIQSGAYMKDMDKTMRVEASKMRIKKAPIIHKYDHNWTKAKVQATAKLLKLKYNIGLLVYDYIKVKEVTGNMKEHSELGNWTIFLKDLAGELDIPVITFGQLSPHERRLADSDKINRYASTIAYLLPKSEDEIKRDYGAENGGKDFIFIDYNRLGGDFNNDPSMGINLIYDRITCRIIQAPYQPIEKTMEGSSDD